MLQDDNPIADLASSTISPKNVKVTYSCGVINAEDYVYESKLGGGSGGVVKLMRRKIDGKHFAMKVTKEILAGRQECHFLAMFIGDPRILQVRRFDMSLDYNFCGIVTEVCSTDLLHVVNGWNHCRVLTGENPPLDRICKILFQLAEAIANVHLKGIVHRDIKPENVFLTKEGDAKLGDFGFADMSESGVFTEICGTYRYMAPEIYKGKPYRFGVDCWSLGVVMYEMVTGKSLFTGETNKDVRDQIMNFVDSGEGIIHPLVPESAPDALSPESWKLLLPLMKSLLNGRPSERPTADAVVESMKIIIESL